MVVQVRPEEVGIGIAVDRGIVFRRVEGRQRAARAPSASRAVRVRVVKRRVGTVRLELPHDFAELSRIRMSR